MHYAASIECGAADLLFTCEGGEMAIRMRAGGSDGSDDSAPVITLINRCC